MEFKTTHIKRAAWAQAGGFTLVEALVAFTITVLVGLVVLSILVNTGRYFSALTNYAEMNAASRFAVDQITRDIREANKVTFFSTNSLVLQDADGNALTWTNDTVAQTFTRIKGADSRILLKGCSALRLDVGQRNVLGGTYDVYSNATPATAKVVDISWVCTRNVLGLSFNTEQIQTARVVIRKQQLP